MKLSIIADIIVVFMQCNISVRQHRTDESGLQGPLGHDEAALGEGSEEGCHRRG